jgi:hypothetical protein
MWKEGRKILEIDHKFFNNLRKSSVRQALVAKACNSSN